MIGHELGGRYELIERVGGGGMALVYKAHDRLLGRKVAVKILRQQFTGDEDFIRRFRREAQAAASLSHPNVVSIYDVGQDGDIHYIIMEYVEGINLNDKIKQQAPLQVEEAVHIASQICDALDHAHQNQIIHRDIKPHNILIGKNGRVKVTDFGIARAATSADITQTGAVLGSVHYFSPEHAKGVAQGAKSDLYSLGIVLYQMLTAKLPFLGDSPISVALKHLQEKVVEPRKVNPLIPQSLENIILKSMRKNPNERYASARQMLADLETCLSPQRMNEPKLAMAAEDEDAERTLIMPAVRDSAPFSSGDADGGLYGGADGDANRRPGMQHAAPRKPRAWIKPVVWIVIVLALLGGMWYAIGYVKNMLEVPDVQVPTVVGLPLEEAQQKLLEAGLTVADPIEYEASDEYDKDVVIRQEKEGETAKQNWPIALVVSSGPVTRTMEDYVGRNWESDVKPELEKLKELGADYELEQVFSDEPPGTVVGHQPEAGASFDPKKTKIVIQLSEGPDVVHMIGVTGNKLAVAQSLLDRENIPYKIRREKEYVERDIVFKQWPYEEGDVVDREEINTPGKELVLYVSEGLPAEAAEMFKPITVSPPEEGSSVHVVITVSDAMGDGVIRKEADISKPTTFPIPLVLSPSKNATITVTMDDEFYDSTTVTYAEALNEMNPDRDVPEEEPEDDGSSMVQFDSDDIGNE